MTEISTLFTSLQKQWIINRLEIKRLSTGALFQNLNNEALTYLDISNNPFLFQAFLCSHHSSPEEIYFSMDENPKNYL